MDIVTMNQASEMKNSDPTKYLHFYNRIVHYTFYSAEQDPGQEVMRTFYEHSVPKLQRMLCSEHHCVVGDGTCIYCMDDDTDLSEAEVKT